MWICGGCGQWKCVSLHYNIQLGPIVYYYDRNILLLDINQVSSGKSNCGSSGKMLTLVNDLEKFSGDLKVGVVYPFLLLTLMHYWKLKPLQMNKKQFITVGWEEMYWVRLRRLKDNSRLVLASLFHFLDSKCWLSGECLKVLVLKENFVMDFPINIFWFSEIC